MNHLYLDGASHSHAQDFVSGMRCLFPRCRRHLDISLQYCKNWGKTLRRTPALPLPVDILLGMVGLCHAYGDERLGALFLLGFLGLLRTGELCSRCGGSKSGS